MKTITLRKIPDDLRKELEKEAAASGTSFAATVIRLLRSATGLSTQNRPSRFDDLDELAGTWSADEAEEFDSVLAAQRTIDRELWD